MATTKCVITKRTTGIKSKITKKTLECLKLPKKITGIGSTITEKTSGKCSFGHDRSETANKVYRYFRTSFDNLEIIKTGSEISVNFVCSFRSIVSERTFSTGFFSD